MSLRHSIALQPGNRRKPRRLERKCTFEISFFPFFLFIIFFPASKGKAKAGWLGVHSCFFPFPPFLMFLLLSTWMDSLEHFLPIKKKKEQSSFLFSAPFKFGRVSFSFCHIIGPVALILSFARAVVYCQIKRKREKGSEMGFEGSTSMLFWFCLFVGRLLLNETIERILFDCFQFFFPDETVFLVSSLNGFK